MGHLIGCEQGRRQAEPILLATSADAAVQGVQGGVICRGSDALWGARVGQAKGRTLAACKN